MVFCIIYFSISEIYKIMLFSLSMTEFHIKNAVWYRHTGSHILTHTQSPTAWLLLHLIPPALCPTDEGGFARVQAHGLDVVSWGHACGPVEHSGVRSLNLMSDTPSDSFIPRTTVQWWLFDSELRTTEFEARKMWGCSIEGFIITKALRS